MITIKPASSYSASARRSYVRLKNGAWSIPWGEKSTKSPWEKPRQEWHGGLFHFVPEGNMEVRYERR